MLDTFPVTARAAGRFCGTNGDKLERAYKEQLSNFNTWEQREHADKWMLLPQNIGSRMSIDETTLHDDLFTILSNKEGHGKQGSIASVVSGTKSTDVLNILMQVPEEERQQVKEVTMDFSESMRSIVKTAFPAATIVVDCFHIMKRCGESVEEIRLKEKRLAVSDVKRQERKHHERLQRNAANRRRYRKKHPKNYAGKKRGRKPQRMNERFTPETFSNGDTLIELLTRSKYFLMKSREKWTDRQKARASILFTRYPKVEEAYKKTDELRRIFKNKGLTKETAGDRLHGWYQSITSCTLRELKAARDTIKAREDEVLNYFVNRSTNAAAESLNAKMKGFRAQLRGINDLPFFMYRLRVLFG